MTATPIVETLAHEFSIKPESVQNLLTMLDAGLTAPFVGRFRRAEVEALPESHIRRLARRRQELEELDRRRGTILRMLERDTTIAPAQLEAIRLCMDRFELEDLFIPHRRPEPEVQLALDRGLGPLADLLVAPLKKGEAAALEAEESAEVESAPAEEAPARDVVAEPAPLEQAVVEQAAAEQAAVEMAAAEQAGGEQAGAEVADAGDDDAELVFDEPAPVAAPAKEIDWSAQMNAHLARLCQPFVQPDRQVHSEAEALAGALRILSDRLGRNARLRGVVRNLLRKNGVLSVRATVDESKVGKHKPLLKIRQPLRQLQGHRLLAIRQGQKERVVATAITLDPAVALPKVRAALGKHTHPAHEALLSEVARQALERRILPMVEPDVRLELKERADQEALRFLSQHLRQILLTPVLPRNPVAGVDVSAKGDWTIVCVDPDGAVLGAEAKVAVGDKTPEALGAELAAILQPAGVRHLALANSKAARAAAPKLRGALKAVGERAWVLLANEAGLSSYANSELARSELAQLAVPARMAASLARRLQDPMAEILKVDPRHLGLGFEQGLVSKANLRRALVETVESSVAHVGCDANHSPPSVLAHLPGIGKEAAAKIVARRAERPFATREELRAEGVLTEAQWAGAIAFLRVCDGPEPLDCTALHPEQYDLVRRVFDSVGLSVEQGLGRPGAIRGLRRDAFGVEEYTWRDMTREMAFPGRDPRPRLWGPNLLDPATEAVRLTKDRVVEGIVSSVAGFGVFVDVGLPTDAIVHISEISDRYVRDARELLSVGQIVRARIVEVGGARLSLSMKNVPPPEHELARREAAKAAREGGRPQRGDGPRGDGARGGRGGPRQGERGGPGRGGRPDRPQREPEKPQNTRAVQSKPQSRFGGPKRGGPGGRGDKRDDRGPRDEYVRLEDVAP
ncbi:MAG: hypothetical protein RL112_1519, partial [Planctomycetota bacterium]